MKVVFIESAWQMRGRADTDFQYLKVYIPKQASVTAKNGKFANKHGAEWSHSKHVVQKAEMFQTALIASCQVFT